MGNGTEVGADRPTGIIEQMAKEVFCNYELAMEIQARLEGLTKRIMGNRDIATLGAEDPLEREQVGKTEQLSTREVVLPATEQGNQVIAQVNRCLSRIQVLVGHLEQL